MAFDRVSYQVDGKINSIHSILISDNYHEAHFITSEKEWQRLQLSYLRVSTERLLGMVLEDMSRDLLPAPVVSFRDYIE